MAPVKGTCLLMCPEEEITMRKSKNLVHLLERDPNKMVKSFSRSAAGRSLNKPRLLRPPSVLKSTISYLLNEVFATASVPFNVIYDFIDDRFNAIRQDATIQEVSEHDWTVILPPIIRFYAYSAYKCHEYDVNTFDPFLNKKHFHECILKLIQIFLRDDNESTADLCSEMVSLLIVANLGDYNVLQRTLPFILKKNVLVQKAMLLSLNILNGNFEQLFKMYNEFPAIHRCMIGVQLPKLRKYTTNLETIKECKHYCIMVIDDKVELSKSSFNNNVDELRLKKTIKFDTNISTMILNI